ncbi:MAG: transcriptional repressor [Candidatus Andersenbacteria bacterium]|nr:transcriptional repressor [Candidatus Andersenbacteria bacterium]
MATTQSRNTKVKQFITQLFQTTPEPISLQEIFRYTKIVLPQTAYSTVFRVVERLKSDHKIHTVDWRERGSRYEWSALPHHHHIVCQICGSITDLEDTDLRFDEAHIHKKTGYITKHHSIELEGICPKCQAKPKVR